MHWIEALILGILQGLTEFLPVSSSGHLEMGKVLLNVDSEGSLIFTIVVHGATVLSTLFVFRKDILKLITGLFQFRWNEETKYIALIFISMVPVGIIALVAKDEAELLFSGNLILVGAMLIVTSALLFFAQRAVSAERSFKPVDALIIGTAQAIAVLPGLSRSGATIATGLMLGKKREEVTRFSFLMVLIPVIGQNLLSLMSGDMSASQSDVPPFALIVGFAGAFVAGLFACRWMIRIVNKGNLRWFALYCLIVGLTAIGFGIF